jgi:MtN3 and saliva related transmembrane protein
MDHDTYVTTLGFLSAIFTTGSWIPQAIRTIRRGSARDFSWLYLMAFTTGVSGWAVYGVLRHDPAILAANVIAFLFLVPIHAVKWRERRRPPRHPEER